MEECACDRGPRQVADVGLVDAHVGQAEVEALEFVERVAGAEVQAVVAVAVERAQRVVRQQAGHVVDGHRPVGAARQVAVGDEVVGVAQVHEQVRGGPDAMVAQHVAEHHLGDALHAVEHVVAGGAIDQIGREVEAVPPGTVAAAFVHVVFRCEGIRIVVGRRGPGRTRLVEGRAEHVVAEVHAERAVACGVGRLAMAVGAVAAGRFGGGQQRASRRRRVAGVAQEGVALAQRFGGQRQRRGRPGHLAQPPLGPDGRRQRIGCQAALERIFDEVDRRHPVAQADHGGPVAVG